MEICNKNKKRKKEDMRHIFNIELCLYIEFMRTAFNPMFMPVPATGKRSNELATNILDRHGNFLETQITSVSAFDKDGNEIKPIHNDPTKPIQFTQTPSRVVANLGYLKMDYVENEDREAFCVDGFKYNYKNELEVSNSIREITCAAYSMAYAAKAQGWSEVDFGNNTDPVERYILIKACREVGLDCGDESIYISALGDKVEVNDAPIHTALFKNEDLKKEDRIDLNKINLHEMDEAKREKILMNINKNIQEHLNNFFESIIMPLEEGGPMPSISPSRQNKQDKTNNTGTKAPAPEFAGAAFT